MAETMQGTMTTEASDSAISTQLRLLSATARTDGLDNRAAIARATGDAS